MKKIILLLLIVSTYANAQKLAEDKTDEFTKVKVKRTVWYPFTKKNGTYRPTRSSYRISKLDTITLLDLEMMINNEVYSINEGDAIMFLMQDGSLVSIKSIKYTITSTGDGTHKYGGSANLGTTSTYLVTEDDIKKLTAGTIMKTRIYTSKGYEEYEVSESLDRGIKNCLKIVQ